MEKSMLRNFGIAAIIITGSLFGVNKLEQNIQENTSLCIDVAEKMSATRDSWRNVYTKLGKEEEYLTRYSNSQKNPFRGLSKEEMKQYLKTSSTILL